MMAAVDSLKKRKPRMWVPLDWKAPVCKLLAEAEKVDALEITEPSGRSRYGPVVVLATPPLEAAGVDGKKNVSVFELPQGPKSHPGTAAVVTALAPVSRLM